MHQLIFSTRCCRLCCRSRPPRPSVIDQVDGGGWSSTHSQSRHNLLVSRIPGRGLLRMLLIIRASFGKLVSTIVVEQLKATTGIFHRCGSIPNGRIRASSWAELGERVVSSRKGPFRPGAINFIGRDMIKRLPVVFQRKREFSKPRIQTIYLFE